MVCLMCRRSFVDERKFDIVTELSRHSSVTLQQLLAGILQKPVDPGFICEHCLALVNEFDNVAVTKRKLRANIASCFRQGVIEETEVETDRQLESNDVREPPIPLLPPDAVTIVKPQVDTSKPFVCEICGQAYKRRGALDVHVGMHNGIHPFRCTYCDKTFTQKGALQRHLPIHTGETPYQCDLCGKRFVHHTSFAIHKSTHSGRKAYKCDTCGLALLSSSHLKRHTRVHTGERKFACVVCGKRFAERYNLVSHRKQLHENHYSAQHSNKCQICPTSFKRRSKLVEHMIKHHQKLEIE